MANIVPRLVEKSLEECLRVKPAVGVTGARQTGKSTLVSELMPGPRRYFSLDDLDVLDAARRDPANTPAGQWTDLLAAQPEEPQDWRALVRRGGLPTPALRTLPPNLYPPFMTLKLVELCERGTEHTHHLEGILTLHPKRSTCIRDFHFLSF